MKFQIKYFNIIQENVSILYKAFENKNYEIVKLLLSNNKIKAGTLNIHILFIPEILKKYILSIGFKIILLK